MAATIKYFGRFPTLIVFQASSDMTGSAQTGTPTLSPGVYLFPVQAAGGLYNFHESPIEVEQISFTGGSGSLAISKVITSVAQTVLVATLNSATPFYSNLLHLAPGEYLTFVTSGATTPVVGITAHEATYAADGAG